MHELVSIIAISVLSGALIAGLALPWVGIAAKGAQASSTAITKDFPLKLHFKPLNERTTVLAANGTPITSFYDQNRVYVPFHKIAPVMRRAIVAIEDSRFYQHGAIDIKGTLRALVENQTHSEIVQGGSTITQQLVKLTLLYNATTRKQQAEATAETYSRKFRELRYAIWVENHYTKQQILEHYLNTAYFGDGAYGIQSAAHHFFHTSASRLNLPQAALLAGLVQNPSGYDPSLHPRIARERRNTVIARMWQLHELTTRRKQHAIHTRLGLHITQTVNGCVSSTYPFFCDYVLNYLLQDPALGKTVQDRKQLIYGGGLTIKTTLEPKVQQAAQKAVSSHVYATDSAIGALAFVQPRTGKVLALAQSRPMGNNSKKGQTFYNYTTPRQLGGAPGFQAGSTFKLFVLTQAIRQGIPLNKTIYAPGVISIPENNYADCNGRNFPASVTWTVHNDTVNGDMNLATGTQWSVNTFFAQLEELTGVCKPWKLAESMGLNLWPARDQLNPQGQVIHLGTRYPPFTLGIADVAPLSMAEAYATMAARGMHCDSDPITEILGRNGEVVSAPKPTCNRVVRPAVADAVNSILAGVMRPGYFGGPFAPRIPSAGKTGTTDSERSVWFVGYTPLIAGAAMVAGVNRAGHPKSLIGMSVGGQTLYAACGACTAGPIWGAAMHVIQNWLPPRQFIPPDPAVIAGQQVPIPSFFGWDPQKAATKLDKLGFNAQIASSVNSSAPLGTVAYTSPSGQGISGETVKIYISNGYQPPPPPTKPTSSPTTSPSPSPSPTGPTSSPTCHGNKKKCGNG